MSTRPLHARMSRRSLLGAGLAAFGATGSAAGQLQNHLPPGVTPKTKGPLVFLDYDQEEIDASYEQSLWAPNQAAITKRNAQKNAAAVARLGPPQRMPYGAMPVEAFDLYRTRRENAPTNVFIHGGAWRSGTAAASAYFAEMFVDRGAHFIAVDFNNVVETKGSLTTMADQVRRAVAWIYKNASRIGADRDRLFVSGTSSGAHLAAVVLTTDWQRDFGLPRDIVKGGLCCSGMYDLYPVSLSRRSAYATFSRPVIEALSPQRHLETLCAPVIVAHGSLETPEFQRQSREFDAAVTRSGHASTLLVGDGYNHFEIHETLGNPYGLLGRAVLRQMKL